MYLLVQNNLTRKRNWCRQGLFIVIALFLFSIKGCKNDNLVEDPVENETKDPSPKEKENFFTIAVIPDPQYYTSSQLGGKNEMLTAQTDWIQKNVEKEKIAYVVCLGDLTDHGDTYLVEWQNAVDAMYRLEKPVSIPYGIAIGNHDQSPNTGYSLTCTTNYYNEFFGVSHFSGRPYYGGNYGVNNDSHYDLFSAEGFEFIALYIEYDSHHQDTENMNSWALDLLDKYPNRKAIIVTHYLLDNGNPGAFGPQALEIYETLKSKPNLFMMLGGHTAGTGEAYRQDTYKGKTIRSFLSDYQGYANGGDGYMRLMRFYPTKNLIDIKTYSPFKNLYFTDWNSEFTKPMLNSIRAADLIGDGKTVLAVFSDGSWKMHGSPNKIFGKRNDIPVPADYDGDGVTEFAVWTPENGVWKVDGIADFSYGQNGDIPVPADYNGDGKAQYAVYRPVYGIWYVSGSSQVHGTSTDIPVPADYNGDGKAEFAVWRPSNGNWLILDNETVAFGQNGDIPVPADWDGDGITDIAVWRPSTGNWLIKGVTESIKLGQNGDVPVPGDYNGDGLTEAAVWRPSTASFYVLGSTIPVGSSTDQPVALPYSIRKFFIP